MFHLVIAKDEKCNEFKIIKSGSYEQLSNYTTKFNDSKEIRTNNKNIVKEFNDLYNDYGDIVIIDDSLSNRRIRVLYKKDILVVKQIIKSQKFMQCLVKNYLIPVAEWDYKAIMYYKGNMYFKHMNNFLKRRKDFFMTIRKIIKYYEKYQKKYKDLPSTYKIYKSIIDNKNKEKRIKEEKVLVSELDSNVKNEEYYDTVNYAYINGGYDEVFTECSIDDLFYNLGEDDFKVLMKSGCRR